MDPPIHPLPTSGAEIDVPVVDLEEHVTHENEGEQSEHHRVNGNQELESLSAPLDGRALVIGVQSSEEPVPFSHSPTISSQAAEAGRYFHDPDEHHHNSQQDIENVRKDQPLHNS